MQTINWTRGSQSGSKRVHDHAYESSVANFRRAGYTVVEAAPAAPATEAAPVTGQTGRVGRGREVHRIVAGHTVCGASWRRNSLGATTRAVQLTGEPVTCQLCR